MQVWDTNVNVATSLDQTKKFRITGAERGVVFVPSGSAITSLNIYCGWGEDAASMLPLYSGASQVSLTVAAGRAYALPSDIFGAISLALVGNAAGTVRVTMVGRD